MNLKALLTHLSKEDTPDEEERVDGQTLVQETSPQGSKNIEDPEKERIDADVPAWGSRTNRRDDKDLEQDDGEVYSEDYLHNVDSVDQSDASLGSPSRFFSRIWSSIFPSPSDEEEIQAYIPHYRIMPIVSGITIPFCILLDIPGLTTAWYIRMDGSTTVASRHNPPLLNIGIAISLLAAVLANACLVVRFLERRIKLMTNLCVLFLSIHDIINIAALVAFRTTKGSYMYSQAFWMTLCSTVVSSFTNVTLIIDLIRTPDFKRSGSGLTRRQRSLVIIIIGLFCYLALGALVNSLLLDLTFINGLFFTIVTIETIGFGDIVPDNAGTRIFIGFYATLGIINLAFVVGYVRETVLEGLDFGYRRRLLEIRERRRAAHLRRCVERRWRHAIVWRLREQRVPVWISKNTDDRKSLWSIFTSYFWHAEWRIRSTARSTHQTRGRRGMQLNLWALPPCQLEAAALEAGCTLDTLLPDGFYDTYEQDVCHHATGVEHHMFPSWFVVHSVYRRDQRASELLIHRWLGGMASIFTKLNFAIYKYSGNPLPNGNGAQDASVPSAPDAFLDRSGSLQTSTTEDGRDYREDVADTEQKAYFTRSSLSWGWFLVFWMGGAAIFKVTEGWTYGLALYFCFISFTTIGYGDLVPITPAGRSIFVVWALIGVATMTIFISVVSEAYTSRYKDILGRNSFQHVVRKYRERNKDELREKVKRIGTGVEVVLHDAFEHEETDIVDVSLSQRSVPVDDSIVLTLASASTSKSSPLVQHAQMSLEKLSKRVLTETRTIHKYMQLISDLNGQLAGADKFDDESVWNLIDNVMAGRRLSQCTKKDILKDAESRQTLMLLGIERSLKELVNISEQAIIALQGRDQVAATLG